MEAVLESLRETYEAQPDAADILSAVSMCFFHRHPVPDWLRAAWIEHYRKWSRCELRTLDEAFNVCRPKGFHLRKARRDADLAYGVALAVRRHHQAGAALEVAYEKAVDEFSKGPLGLSAADAKRYYYAVKKEIGWED